MSSSERKSSINCRPWKLLRLALRIVFFSLLTWFILALLWAFLPAPLRDNDPDNGSIYATARLRAGKTLTRVYDSDYFRSEKNQHRQGFALDYKLDLDALTLTISGSEHGLPIFQVDQNTKSITEQINATARTGDRDGANLPWFEFADAVLLYWWIQKEHLEIPMDITWSVEAEGELRRMEVQIAGRLNSRPLLTLEMQGFDAETIVVEVPERPYSFSPSKTYPVRLAIIRVIAPTSVFLYKLLGNAVGQAIQSIISALFVLFVITVHGFLITAIVLSIWRCVGGPSFEVVVERVQARLERLSQNERLRVLRIAALQDRLDRLCQNERFQAAVEVCRNGWHPERQVGRPDDAEVDVEKEASPKDDLD
ncbi:hypothetical protein L207DRAFT_440479 [Hyaloscypha variabilis F]|uniref:Uncharacterized protein n=1 Tax=Hyaloscypha variabilis (strain UAMH 11265 / GT02V1 / F) TaxID=1149755 RepID=A0A2J6R1L9_HYAVF|nr:hypothetical protein L207DRAFT_440479 [Hyaloscypha variabilis F]